MVPLNDLRRRIAACQPEMGAAVARVLASGRLLLGPELEAFERDFAAYVGRRFAVGVSSGTDAISLSLAGLGVGPGDEVVVPAFTAVPTLAAVCALGAVPVPVDVDAETGAIDPAAVRAALGARTRAIVPVHLYGRPAEEEIGELAAFGLPVVDDAAHAHGALRNRQPPRGRLPRQQVLCEDDAHRLRLVIGIHPDQPRLIRISVHQRRYRIRLGAFERAALHEIALYRVERRQFGMTRLQGLDLGRDAKQATDEIVEMRGQIDQQLAFVLVRKRVGRGAAGLQAGRQGCVDLRDKPDKSCIQPH